MVSGILFVSLHLPFSSPRLSSYMELLLVFLSSVVVLVCDLRLLVFCFIACFAVCLCCGGVFLRGGYIVCEWSMSSLSADLLHRRKVLPHMSSMLLSFFFFVLLLLVGRSGG